MTYQHPQIKPQLIVFDLDYTLWPFWVDSHVDPPFTKKRDGKVYDRRNKLVSYYPDVPMILEQLKREGYTLAVASRTTCNEEALQLMELFNWMKYFTYIEIFPGSKVQHFQRFQQKTGLPLTSMLFFDDESRNIVDCSRIGVTCILAHGGVNKKLVQDGLQQFTANRSRGGTRGGLKGTEGSPTICEETLEPPLLQPIFSQFYIFF